MGKTKKRAAKTKATTPRKKAEKKKTPKESAEKKQEKSRKEFPKNFPFWARLKISKKRTTLVIDEEDAYNKKKKRMEEGFVHREAIHSNEDGSNVKGLEIIKPNPDSTDKNPMYLKRPTKLPKRMFEPHNKDLKMPEHLKARYDKNNKKE